MKRLWLVVLAGLFAASLAGCGKGNVEESFPMSVEIGELEAVNQNGDTVKLSELNEDKIVIADFIFTNCDTVCLPMTANMAKLQNKIKEAGLQDDVQFVSISIDPEEDTPETLTEYSKRHSADYSNWTFLTGYTRDEIESFANVSFKTPAAKVEGSNQFVHATSFFLVGESGTLLNKYEGVSDPPFEEMIKDIEKLN
ncbi:cysteine ABC transporter ATP-binding protein [[Bacillus] enclensis]|uniref:Protein SCO1/2 n=1 Tax=[Bacillus] enclensis TaxID=1402860 RepID=A0A0V8HER5_9BACI|nr:SCO family protein [[Bacillus] enclensis]KSU61004.1 cysteine ABC transporter ATP-binding protein [[Bacillus] enclensis]SCC21748.1 protein SCO1/2 [[Bacillus] enclensis]